MGDVIATGIAWTIIAIAAGVLIGMAIRHMTGGDVPTPTPPDATPADVDELERMAHIWFELWDADRRSHPSQQDPDQ